MDAQDLYDAREEFGHIDGMELHRLFHELIGDPSPAGRTPIDPHALRSHIGQWNANMDTFIESVLQNFVRTA